MRAFIADRRIRFLRGRRPNPDVRESPLPAEAEEMAWPPSLQPATDAS